MSAQSNASRRLFLAAGAPLFVEYKAGTRRRIAAAVDALVALLDQIDGDADLEEDDPLEDDAPCELVGDGADGAL